MKLKLLVAAISLVSFSGMAGGFDLGKILQDQLKKSQSKSAPAQPTDSATSPQTSTPQNDKGAEAQALSFGLFGKYSTEDEIHIGKQIAGNLLGAVPMVRDEALQRYVNLVGNWVAAQSGRTDIPWRFGVLDTEDINAFAAPGGYVFVTKGLYRQLANEAELAGVLGHEIAHITKKHHLKVLKKSSLISALGQAASKQAKSSDQVVQNLIGNGAEIMARGLDKDAEFEADREGVVFAARAGYDPWGLPAVLQDLAALPAKDGRTSLLFKTHPQPADRLSKLGDAIGDRFDKLSGKELGDRFYRIR
ncbi:MAG: M48 family metalloprotease [Thiobacillaceae bacterium]